MTTERIYFQKFDELEAILGQKPHYPDSMAERIARRIKAATAAARNIGRRGNTAPADTAPAAG